MKTDIPVYDIGSISQAMEEDILVSRFAPYSKSHSHLHYPHRHNFYHMVLFTEGAGSHAIDFQQFPVAPWNIYFMIPGQVHSWSFTGRVDGYVINFSKQFFESFLLRPNYLDNFPFFSGSVKEAVLEVPDGAREDIKSIFEEILREDAATEPFNFDYLRTLLLQLFIKVARFTTGKDHGASPSYNQTLLRNFQQLIETNYKNLRLPKEYAELLYITPNHLNALCNDLMGIPAGEVIRNRVALEAKRLLVNLELPVAEIAYSLNFSDNSYFTKFFKKQVGMTPEQFRKNALKNNI